MAENNDDEKLDALGVDLDVVEMTFTNPDSACNSLLECRLMLKVDAYRCELERFKLKKANGFYTLKSDCMIISGPFIKLLHLQPQELARL